MSLSDLITVNAILPALKVNGKKQALQEISERAEAVSGLNAREIFDALLQRERLNSTGLGNGVAIPHGKLVKAKKIFGVFARLDRPIDFESLDGAPVDLIFALIAPWNRPGPITSRRSPTSPGYCAIQAHADKIRATREAPALYALLTQSAASFAA